ncbi:hypothetical protein EON66_07430 [archaeon]|nr:MAG: hypothetical protein EON66_07430 [archaeon]
MSPAQLQMMITTIAPYKSEEEVAHMLATVDPFGHGRITFSECVGLLSADLAASLTVAGPAADALMRLPSQLTDTYPQASLLAGGLEMLASGNMASSFREAPPGGAAAASAPTSLARTPSYAGRHASGGPTAGGGSTALPRSASSASTRGASASRTTGRATPSFRSR